MWILNGGAQADLFTLIIASHLLYTLSVSLVLVLENSFLSLYPERQCSRSAVAGVNHKSRFFAGSAELTPL